MIVQPPGIFSETTLSGANGARSSQHDEVLVRPSQRPLSFHPASLGLSTFPLLPDVVLACILFFIFSPLFPLVITQIRGPILGASPPSPLPYGPCLLVERRFQHCPPSSTRVEFRLLTPFFQFHFAKIVQISP